MTTKSHSSSDMKKVLETGYFNGGAWFSGPRNFRRQNLKLPPNGIRVLARLGNKVKIQSSPTAVPCWLTYQFVVLN